MSKETTMREGKIVDVRWELKEEEEEKEKFWRVCHMLEVFSEHEVDLKIKWNRVEYET